jgi:hypothetical protein
MASHFLRKNGVFRPAEMSTLDAAKSKVLGPLMALRGKIAWLLDPTSGEEICAVLSDD